MNFFEQQDQARRKTRGLVLLFILATVLIVAAVTGVVGGVVAVSEQNQARERGVQLRGSFLDRHAGTLGLTALATLGLILMGSLTKTVGLRAGGGSVARSLGGVPVDPMDRDPHRRRLRNVVEEMAIASGTPVPEIYLMEQEEGINAFAAGLTPGDAAIGVTHGTVTRLTRAELQGVIAHEFSHILNGDMRLNMKLMGVLHGILLIGITGQSILRMAFYSSMFRGSSRKKDSGGGAMAVIVIGGGLMVVGFIGVMFGQIIKAAVSRQREYLADASAVQFTREPAGIAGALKKIGGFTSRLKSPKAEEVSHMLFGTGTGLSSLFATHPPITDRIRALDPNFDPRELENFRDPRGDDAYADAAGFAGGEAGGAGLASGLAAAGGGSAASVGTGATAEGTAAGATTKGAAASHRDGVRVTPAEVVASAGQVSPSGVLHAQSVLDRISPELRESAASAGGAESVVFALLMSPDNTVAARQEGILEQRHGVETRRMVSRALPEIRGIDREGRLSLVDLAFPGLRHHPPHERRRFLDTVDALVGADGRIDLFEYALSRVLRTHVWDLDGASPGGNKPLASQADHAEVLVSVLAVVGHSEMAAAGAAMSAGMSALGLPRSSRSLPPDDWVAATDLALENLDTLRAPDKQRLLEGLVVTVSHDGMVIPEEADTLRAVCEAIHVPLPPLG